MRGHGDAVAGPDLKTTVFRAIYTEVNARLQMQAVALGGPINFLNQYEQAKSQNVVDRPWDKVWRKQGRRRLSISGRRPARIRFPRALG